MAKREEGLHRPITSRAMRKGDSAIRANMLLRLWDELSPTRTPVISKGCSIACCLDHAKVAWDSCKPAPLPDIAFHKVEWTPEVEIPRGYLKLVNLGRLDIRMADLAWKMPMRPGCATSADGCTDHRSRKEAEMSPM